VDLSVQGKAVRFINTHLDGDCSDPAFQRAQAQEILDGPVQDARNKNLPVVLLGDLNSKADGSGTPTYAELLKVGFVDSWAEVGRGSGFTCCQDDDLLNKVSHLSDRRAFVLLGGPSSSSATGPSRLLRSKWSARVRPIAPHRVCGHPIMPG